VRSTAWGTLGTFSFTEGGSTTTATGQNVAGSIAGVAATGLGQVLSLAPTVSSPAAGLRLLVEGSSTGALGNVAYATGVAGRVRQLGRDSQDSMSVLYSARTSREARVKSFDTQMAAMEKRVKAKEEQLRRQYSAMDSTIGRLQNVSSWLAQQTNSMQANN
jgi:flagellar hook-associated protein 2